MAKNGKIIILVDTREWRCGYDFKKYDCITEEATLSTGDYSIRGFADDLNGIAIERKELNDLVGCLMDGKNGGRERFEKELARAQRMLGQFSVVVEASMDDIRKHNYTSKMTPHAVLQSVSALSVRYKTQFWFAGSRVGGEYMTYSLLSKYYEEIEKRWKLAAMALVI